jgi:hypothetical protein
MEEINVLTKFDRTIVRKVYGPLKDGECWRIIRKKEITGHITRGRYCKIYKIPLTKMVWSCGKNAKPNNAKTNCRSYKGRNKENRKTM